MLRVELQNFQARKRLLEYDDVMNQQRDVVYSLRKFALDKGEELTAEALRMVDGALTRLVQSQLADSRSPEEYDRPALHAALLMQYLVQAQPVLEPTATPDLVRIQAAVREEGHETYRRKRTYLEEFARTISVPDVYEQVLSNVMLAVLDEKWKDHLYDLDQLRHAIQYRAYGQRDPLVEYKREAFEMFEDLMRDIQSTFTERFLKIQVSSEAPRPPAAAPPRRPPPTVETSGSSDMMPGAAPDLPASRPTPEVRMGGRPIRPPVSPDAAPVGRNDPCPCGSGKKYKKCHGAGS
jgi:preprotein translocase subunit SecA